MQPFSKGIHVEALRTSACKVHSSVVCMTSLTTNPYYCENIWVQLGSLTWIHGCQYMHDHICKQIRLYNSKLHYITCMLKQ